MAPAPPIADFRRQRRAGMIYIAIGAVGAIALWYGVTRWAPPLDGMDSLAARMLFTLKCWAVVMTFSLLAGVEAVAHERLRSPAFDPLAGFETRRLKVNQRYLQNTLEQAVIFTAALFGLAAYCADGRSMRTVVAASLVWLAARFAFWIGYHHSAAARGLGVGGMGLSLILVVYVCARFGGEIAGRPGAIAMIAAFVALEGFLFWATRPLKAGDPA
jgi:hypothetical protein